MAPLYLGIKQGFFEEQNLKIEPQDSPRAARRSPRPCSAATSRSASNTVSLLIAASKDLPVTIISQGVLGGKTEEEAWADLLVLKDGPIKEPKDLEGKTVIAVNTLKNICEVTYRKSLSDMGVDDSTLKFTEVPFPDMNAALEAERVDGACVVEPFVSQGKAGKAKGIDPFYVNTAPDLTVATYFTSKQYAEENPDVVKRFVTAMQQSGSTTRRATRTPSARSSPSTTQIPPEAAANIKLPQWRQDITLDTVELLSQLSLEYGLIESEPDLNELIAD